MHTVHETVIPSRSLIKVKSFYSTPLLPPLFYRSRWTLGSPRVSPYSATNGFTDGYSSKYAIANFQLFFFFFGVCTLRAHTYSCRELHGDNALQYGGSAATAAVARLCEHAGAVQPGSARLEGHHAARLAVRQTRRASHAVGDGHSHVGTARHRNTRGARWTQLTAVSVLFYNMIKSVLKQSNVDDENNSL